MNPKANCLNFFAGYYSSGLAYTVYKKTEPSTANGNVNKMAEEVYYATVTVSDCKMVSKVKREVLH